MMLTTFEVCLRLFAASMAGGLIGMQRERVNQTAGFRTHILITVGVALVMIISTTRYAPGAVGNDPMRLASQAISGIGFLGAGAIIKEGATIRGLTTATGLWVSAAIGLAFGAGMYREGVIVTVIVLITFTILLHWKQRVFTEHVDEKKAAPAKLEKNSVKMTVTRDLSTGFIEDIREVLHVHGFDIIRIAIDRGRSTEGEDKGVFLFILTLPASREASADACLSAIHRLPGIEHIELETVE
ncbi:MAG: MgtC/SapB family protein [Peptoniphilus sp.]|nr:MgtC/SapB family protein [Peptoniphilus sp.]MDD7363422.1 MgtC/SapB family protein [Bacillota bacterium]MDY6044424.1 MgtC/SapB family protein [Peptoniphilus sp.]